MNDNEIKILNKNSELYLPKVEFWIMDDLQLKVVEAQLYKMILQKGYITWTWEYMGKVLRVSRSSVYRMLTKLLDRNLISARTVAVQDGGGRRERVTYVANYTVDGRRTDSEIVKLLNQGVDKIKATYNDRRYYKRRK